MNVHNANGSNVDIQRHTLDIYSFTSSIQKIKGHCYILQLNALQDVNITYLVTSNESFLKVTSPQMMKFKTMYNKFQNDLCLIHPKPLNKVIMFVDGFDVVFIRPSTIILDKFLYSKNWNSVKQIIFNAEMYCWPPWNIIQKQVHLEGHDYVAPPLQFKDIVYRYLNIGGYIGKLNNLCKALKTCIDNIPFNSTFLWKDQNIMQICFNKFNYNNTITLDYGQEIFNTMEFWPANRTDIQYIHQQNEKNETVLVNTYTHTSPSMLHFNGNGKARINMLLKYYLDKMNQMDSNEKNQVNQKVVKFEYDNGTKTSMKIGEICPLK